MPTQIRLIPQQIADLAAIRELGAERVRNVVEFLRGLEAVPLRPETLHDYFANALGGDDRLAECLLRPVLALSQLLRQREVNVGEVLEGLRFAVTTVVPAWGEEDLAAWDAVAPHFGELFQAQPVRTVSKAIDLAYEHANLFQGARIVTDIRPIFNDGDDEQMEIDGAVVAFTLRLHYDNREGNHSLSVALDEADVRTLNYQCERALHKAELAQRRMQDMAGVPTVISGEANDESDD